MDKEYKYHTPVLLNEVIEFLKPKENQNFIDCTVGFSGHAREILKRTKPSGKLLGIDLDKKALRESQKELSAHKERTIFIEDNYSNIEKIAKENGFNKISGILFDFGISSFQLKDDERGFSYRKDSLLDMSFGKKNIKRSTFEILNYSNKQDLIDIFRNYGELNNYQANRLVQEIIKSRSKQKINSTKDLKEIVLKIIPGKFKKESVLSRAFQAIRIETNQELKSIEEGIKGALNILDKGGRVVCISYHSLEDRIVKNIFRQEAKDCICPTEIPECRCEHKAIIKLINKKPIIPLISEIKKNTRSRSAKMRVAEKI